MTKLDNIFATDSLDRVISFGNTIEHLPTKESVETFFKAVHKILKPEGLLIVQIINYDRVIDQDITSLPSH